MASHRAGFLCRIGGLRGGLVGRVRSISLAGAGRSFCILKWHPSGQLQSGGAVLVVGDEWQFYLVLPLICFLAFRLGFWRGSFLAIGACVGFRVWIWLGHPEWSVIFEGQLPFRLVEFVWGMMAAYLFSRGTIPPACLRGLKGFLLGLAVAFTGRFLRVTEIVQSTTSLGPLFKALAEPVMSLGFALILWNSISSDSIISQGLCHKSMTAIGRWSYSLYLWHWYPSIWISHFVIRRYGSSTLTQYLAFAITLAVVVPFSWQSYKWLEAFYFRKKHHS